MLAQLAIRDIVLIERLDLSFDAGLSVLTGETGAGKSILLDAFALALGGRGDGGLVRAGATQGQVTAAFDLPVEHPARRIAAEQGLDVDGDLILRRVQFADGRTRAFVNDATVSVQTLRALGVGLVEIHGQHADRALVDAGAHRSLIDAYGGLGGAAAGVAAAFRRWRGLEAEQADEAARIARARAEADYLRHAHEELSKLAPEAGEEDLLAARRTEMQQGEKVAGDLREAYDELAGDGSPIAGLSSTLRRLERRRPQAPDLIEPPSRALDAALDALETARQALDDALRAADFDPAELERVEDRLFALRGASRKYATPVEALPALAEKYAADLAALDAGEARLAQLGRDVIAARAAYDTAAGALSVARAKTAKALDAAVMKELAPLKLERARFMTMIATDAAQPAAEGVDRVEFWVETNPGSRPGPMMKIASGGELARFMLALKVALAERGSAPTLVFDEIDTGVGGAVADAIGHRLKRLAGGVQVLAVTHAPQVAARADAHLRISKSEAPGAKPAPRAALATRVEPLAEPARREEIARMLAGATITDEARAAAARLIEGAK